MNTSIEVIERWKCLINSEQVLPGKMLSNLDVNLYLDARDCSKDFSEKCLGLWGQSEQLILDSTFEELHQLIFKKCTLALGVTELSCYIAEDIELLVRCEATGLEDTFLSSLTTAYLSGRLPLLTL